MADSKPTTGAAAFFEHFWVRVAVVVLTAVWSAWEWLFNHDEFWGWLTLAATAYGAWELIIKRMIKGPPPPSDAPPAA